MEKSRGFEAHGFLEVGEDLFIIQIDADGKAVRLMNAAGEDETITPWCDLVEDGTEDGATFEVPGHDREYRIGDFSMI